MFSKFVFRQRTSQCKRLFQPYIGVNSLDELIDKTIPANIRLKEPLALTSPLTKYEFGKHIAELAAKNKLYTTYIGLGWYNTITPAVIQTSLRYLCLVRSVRSIPYRVFKYIPLDNSRGDRVVPSQTDRRVLFRSCFPNSYSVSGLVNASGSFSRILA